MPQAARHRNVPVSSHLPSFVHELRQGRPHGEQGVDEVYFHGPVRIWPLSSYCERSTRPFTTPCSPWEHLKSDQSINQSIKLNQSINHLCTVLTYLITGHALQQEPRDFRLSLKLRAGYSGVIFRFRHRFLDWKKSHSMKWDYRRRRNDDGTHVEFRVVFARFLQFIPRRVQVQSSVVQLFSFFLKIEKETHIKRTEIKFKNTKKKIFNLKKIFLKKFSLKKIFFKKKWFPVFGIFDLILFCNDKISQMLKILMWIQTLFWNKKHNYRGFSIFFRFENWEEKISLARTVLMSPSRNLLRGVRKTSAELETNSSSACPRRFW